MEPACRIGALAIPAQQTAHGKRMTEIMQAWWRDSVRKGESQGADQRMERLTGGARMNAAVAVEAEQRCLGVRLRIGNPAPLDLGADQFGDAGAVRDQAALSELTASHDQQAAVSVDVAQAQPARLACAQTESVAESEDNAIRRTTLLCARVVRKSVRRRQQAAGLEHIEDEWETSGGHSTTPNLKRRDGQQLLDDGPVEETANHAQEVVEAARTLSGPRSQEVLQ